jgi:hypothetical protein
MLAPSTRRRDGLLAYLRLNKEEEEKRRQSGKICTGLLASDKLTQAVKLLTSIQNCVIRITVRTQFILTLLFCIFPTRSRHIRHIFLKYATTTSFNVLSQIIILCHPT